jgi:hypothetical protein
MVSDMARFEKGERYQEVEPSEALEGLVHVTLLVSYTCKAKRYTKNNINIAVAFASGTVYATQNQHSR